MNEVTITLSRDDVASLVAAVADVEAIIHGASDEDVSLEVAYEQLDRITANISGQVDAQN